MKTRPHSGLILLAGTVLVSVYRIRYSLLGEDLHSEKVANGTKLPADYVTRFEETNHTINCGRRSAPACAECTSADDDGSGCRGECAWSPSSAGGSGGTCRLKPSSSSAVRLASSDSSAVDDCAFFYVRVPKTGSTSMHNTIVGDATARRLVCSQKEHVPIPRLDGRHRVGTFLVTVRDPYERFASQYRYMYGNTAHASKALQLRFKAKYPRVDDLVSDLKGARKMYLSALYWRSMTYYVPLDWLAGNGDRTKFLCASTSSNSTTLHEQLERAIGAKIPGVPAHHNPTGGIVRGGTDNFTVLSEKSRNILAESFLRSDLELYRLSGCSAL